MIEWVSTEYDSLVLVGKNLALNVLLYSTRQHNLLEIATFVYQIGYGILVGDAHDVLLNDRTGIELSGHIVACSTDEFHSTLIGGMIGLSTHESREE